MIDRIAAAVCANHRPGTMPFAALRKTARTDVDVNGVRLSQQDRPSLRADPMTK
ncbi:hypothetical protein K788_0006269 (plasmid) [Paraburkholderia caribensis MBA4]|uniref:Uncharacterized protein n=1 Tax=Paraburkholderia caribensis MBA4 TaxID=1323664 RepID=A0A0P0RLY1_9BURK|nr:hypothetical protein K788_0006269 [Paraburkholderia caribensis MBA4]